MFDRVYDFFYGDQLRKHLVLISAFFLGQLFAIPVLGWLEPSQYVILAVTLSFISIYPLTMLYSKFHPVRKEVIEKITQDNIFRRDHELIIQVLRRQQAKRAEIYQKMMEMLHVIYASREMHSEEIEKIDGMFLSVQERSIKELDEVSDRNTASKEEVMKLLESMTFMDRTVLETVMKRLKTTIEENKKG